jgi:SHS2 domain-containing protein
MKYKFLSHTGDAKFQAFGETLENAFQNTALALASLMWNPTDIKEKEEKTIQVSGRDRQQLLVTFLEEVLFLWESRQFMLSACRKLRIEENKDGLNLEAVLSGDSRPAEYEISGGVKAVTYNEMEIKQNNRWTVQVVVDI